MVDKIVNFNWDIFTELLKKVITFKTKTSFIYVNAENWEEAIFLALKRMNEDPDWKLGSHAKGTDIKTKKFAISAKSGSIEGGYLRISSYRLTRYKDINEMNNFINKIDYDYYLCCARNDTKDGGREYIIYLINSSVFRPRVSDWKPYKNKNGKVAGYACNIQNGTKGKIVYNMSNQLWIDIPLKLCRKLFEVRFKTDEIGSDLDKIFDG